MVAASRTSLCLAFALLSAACGVVLPPAESFEDVDQGDKDPVTTKGANLPAPSGAEAEPGVGTPGTPGTPGNAAPPTTPSTRVYAVFVTSQVWSSDEVGGLSGADQKCASLASSNPALQNKKWAAWLSSGMSAVARLGSTPGPWARVDGSSVATDRAHLSSGLLPLHSAIAIDEQGSLHGDDAVWTGTRADGNASANTCNGWNGTNGRGLYGKIDFAKPRWTQAGDVECDGDDDWDYGAGGWSRPRNRLYCFEID